MKIHDFVFIKLFLFDFLTDGGGGGAKFGATIKKSTRMSLLYGSAFARYSGSGYVLQWTPDVWNVCSPSVAERKSVSRLPPANIKDCERSPLGCFCHSYNDLFYDVQLQAQFLHRDQVWS
jgi:hypothetical protein